jgi:hypothetical protein
MSPLRKNYIAMALFILAIVGFGVLATQIDERWALGVFAVGAIYGAWTLLFRCPKCGTPYLYKFKANGLLVVPTRFPKSCTKCGYPTR